MRPWQTQHAHLNAPMPANHADFRRFDLQFRQAIHGIWVLNTYEMTRNMPYYGLVFNRFVVFVSKHSKSYENLKVSTKVSLLGVDSLCTLGDFRNISTIFIFSLAVPPHNFCNFDTKML